jgi:hypothetical protein
MKQISTSQNKFVIVDNEDFEKLSKYTWSLSKGYASYGRWENGKKGKCTSYKMHRIIMNAKKGQEVDHIDGNTLNNQKSNLRIVTKTQNQMNRKIQKNNISGYKGVTWCKRTKKWIAQIRVETKTKFLGYFDDKNIAGNVYNLNAKKYFGEFAKLNTIL